MSKLSSGAFVAVLTGAGGYFCAGADLKALATGDRRPVGATGRGPMGPTRMLLVGAGGTTKSCDYHGACSAQRVTEDARNLGDLEGHHVAT